MLEHGRQKLLMNIHDRENHPNGEIASSHRSEGYREASRMENEPSRKRPSSTVEDVPGDQVQDYIDTSSSEDNCLRMSTYGKREG
jgi:hypothetical protein